MSALRTNRHPRYGSEHSERGTREEGAELAMELQLGYLARMMDRINVHVAGDRASPSCFVTKTFLIDRLFRLRRRIVTWKVGGHVVGQLSDLPR